MWSSLAAFVNGHDPTEELRETLGLGRGTGRVRALLAVAAGPLTVAELARQLTIDPPYATLIADELAALGLVERTVDGEDRRRKQLTLTDAGRTAARTADAIIRKPPRRCLLCLSTNSSDSDRRSRSYATSTRSCLPVLSTAPRSPSLSDSPDGVFVPRPESRNQSASCRNPCKSSGVARPARPGVVPQGRGVLAAQLLPGRRPRSG